MDSIERRAPEAPRSNIVFHLLLVVGSLLIAGLLLALIEVGLRVAGIGGPDASRTSRLEYQQIFLPILEPTERAGGTAIYRSVDPRLPYQSVLADKPAGSLRIFTFGGSATAGLGYSPNVTFARYLEKMLVSAAPGRPVEVVNLGIVALSVKQVEVLVKHVVERFEPDLLVVYSGNNEFLEPHAEKLAASRATVAARARDALASLHLTRSLRRALQGPPKPPSLADQDFSRDDLRLTQNEIIREIEMSPEEIGEVVDRYGSHMREIAGTAAAAGVPTILMSVASNWEWRGREDLPETWIDEVVPPEAGAASGQISPDRYRRALTALAARLAAAAHDERHEWLFRQALAHQALGEVAAARDSYRAAMNADPHLRRALDVMNGEVAAAAAQEGITYLDTVAYLEANAPDGIVGFDEL
ncbi:MAG: hypothetical protein MI919_29500, partial [Holophagales bacterium]|nr:hypothetical protein [Holophagales bacterium]